MNQIIEAVRSTVPEDMWPEIVAKLDGAEQHPEPLDWRATTERMTSSTPIEFAEEDDDEI